METSGAKFVIKPDVTRTLGAITRGPQQEKKMAFVFTGGDYGDCGEVILDTLKKNNIKGSFFFTGTFFKKPEFAPVIKRIVAEGHYISVHSYDHLLYCDWTERTKTLVTQDQFEKDLEKNFEQLKTFGVKKEDALFWIPPYEWHNEDIAKWSDKIGLHLMNITTGTLSHADYTQDTDKNFRSNDVIYKSIIDKEQKDGLNGYMLLIHIGAADGRKEKFAAKRLPELVDYLKGKGYSFCRVDELLADKQQDGK